MSLQEYAKQLLGRMHDFYLATLREDGMPDIRLLSAAKADGFKTIWTITHAQYRKIEELKHDKRCAVYVTSAPGEEFAELRLWGECEISTDRSLIDGIWFDGYIKRFPRGKDDPNVRVLIFHAKSGQLLTKAGLETLAF